MDRSHLIVVALGAALAIRVIMHFVDKNRIREEVERKGGKIVSIRWDPFGRGWFFEKNERHYAVAYLDRSGTTISATCKTSLFTGIYWTDAPVAVELGPRLISRHRCSKCGYTLQVEWRACPNCGKATELA